ARTRRWAMAKDRPPPALRGQLSYRIPSESGWPVLPRGESCCTGLPGCGDACCGPGSLNCGVMGVVTSGAKPPRAGGAARDADPADGGAAHAGWASMNATARKASERWTLMVNSRSCIVSPAERAAPPAAAVATVGMYA